MLAKAALSLAAFGLAGCASTVAKILPIGEPVTLERCQAMDTTKMGFDDGKTGQRIYEKLEFWRKDCAAFGVTLDRARYEQGYNDGLAIYCSCENGFQAGVKEEIAEIKGQILMCKKAEYAKYMAGHEQGKLQIKNEELVKKSGQFKYDYNEANIQAMAKSTCAIQ